MITLLGGVLTASLLGSLHCAGMCGPLAVVAGAPVQLTNNGGELPQSARAGARAGVVVLSTVYNLGRLVTYVALGAVAGAIGKAFDFGGGSLGVQRGATIAAGVMLLTMGLVMLLELAGLRVWDRAAPGALKRWLSGAHRAVSRYGPLSRAGLIGVLSGLLPCGWLYAFVVSAGGTASPLMGALVMLAFWVGTVPVLAVVGTGLHTLIKPIRRHVPVVTALLLIGVGVWSLVWRSSMIFSPNAGESGEPMCPLCETREGH